MNIFSPSQVMILTLGFGFLFTLILISSYGHNEFNHKSKLIFIFSKLLQIIGWISLGFSPGPYETFLLSLSNSLFFISFTLEILSILMLKNLLRRGDKIYLYSMMTLGLVGYNFILLFYNDLGLRIIFYSIINILIYLLIYRIIFAKNGTSLMRIVGYLYTLYIFATFIRLVLTIISSTEPDKLSFIKFQTVFLLTIYIFANLITVGFVLLMKEEADRDLFRFAHFDDLTCVLNRRSFNEKAEYIIKFCTKKKQPITYILFDIDHFKSINDTYGHIVGDEVLKQLTHTIRPYLSRKDIFGRYGGDEFAILIRDQSEEDALAIIKNMISSIEPLHFNEIVVSYSISIGYITTIPITSTRVEQLYSNCDKALYEAKQNGRNIYVKGFI